MFRSITSWANLGVVIITLLIFAAPSTALAIDRLVPSQYPTIQAAISAAVEGDHVVIAPGTYQGDGNRDIDFMGKAITVRSTDSNDPNVVAMTVIDCGCDPNSPPADPNDYHRGFYFHNGEDANSVLAGVTITNGCGREEYIDPGWVQETSAGGGIACNGASPVISDCRIIGNSALVGGGVACWEGSSARIARCTIAANSDGDIPGPPSPGGLGGGLFLYHGGNLTLQHCEITGNSTEVMGGGVYTDGNVSVVIDGCIVDGNSSGTAGGIACGEDNGLIRNCMIRGNSGGGVLCGTDANLTIRSCLIVHNSVTELLYSGGGLAIGWGSPTVSNCTIAGNHAVGNGGGVGVGVAGEEASLTLTNCILWGNVADQDGDQVSVGGTEILPSNASLTASYCDVQGGPNEIHVEPNCTLIWDPNTNIDADPCFVDSDGPDDDPNTWEDNDHHLTPNSPCINAGDPYLDYSDETDIDAQRRLMGADVDIGSDEYLYPILVLTIVGDDKGDVTVDPNLAYYEPNATVTLTAYPDDGKGFHGWTGDVPEDQKYMNPITISMDADKEVSATFKCGFGVGPFLPLVAIGLLGFAVLRQRR